jgi:hypothetical protein
MAPVFSFSGDVPVGRRYSIQGNDLLSRWGDAQGLRLGGDG